MYKYLHNIKFNYSIISVILTPASPSLQVREFPLQTGGEKGLRETISSKNRLLSDSSMGLNIQSERNNHLSVFTRDLPHIQY